MKQKLHIIYGIQVPLGEIKAIEKSNTDLSIFYGNSEDFILFGKLLSEIECKDGVALSSCELPENEKIDIIGKIQQIIPNIPSAKFYALTHWS